MGCFISDKTVGVFHYRSPLGTYKLNYTEAQEACKQAGGIIATFTQLSYAQQVCINVCKHMLWHKIYYELRGMIPFVCSAGWIYHVLSRVACTEPGSLSHELLQP